MRKGGSTTWLHKLSVRRNDQVWDPAKAWEGNWQRSGTPECRLWCSQRTAAQNILKDNAAPNHWKHFFKEFSANLQGTDCQINPRMVMCVYVVFKPQKTSSELSCISLSAFLGSTTVETVPQHRTSWSSTTILLLWSRFFFKTSLYDNHNQCCCPKVFYFFTLRNLFLG